MIWRKGRGMANSCAFGSFASARNPVLRDVHEYVLVFSKGRMDRVRQGQVDGTVTAHQRRGLRVPDDRVVLDPHRGAMVSRAGSATTSGSGRASEGSGGPRRPVSP